MINRTARKLVTALIGAVLFAALPSIAAAEIPAASPRSSIVVAVSDAAHVATVRAALEAAGGTVKKTFRWNALLVSAPVGMGSAQFSAVATKVGGVRYAQGDMTYHALGTANDPLYSQQWGLPNIGAPAAWDRAEGAGVAIAILDTGIDSTHTDLAGNVVLYHNYVNPAASAADDEGHGTHVAGIAGAVRNNSLFGAGTAPKAKLYAFKVLDSTGSGSDSSIASAIRDAVDLTPCRIISMSLGGPAGSSGDRLLQDSIAYALSKGAIVIAAAGNDGSTALSYPAAITGVIGVGAVDSSDVLASFSNRGTADEDIVAPGVGILSTVPGNTTSSWSGTSMATPFVSGAAALVWSAHPELSATQVTDLLLSTARDLGAAGVDTLYGHGLVRPDLAIAAVPVADTTPPTTSSDAVASYVGAVTIHLSATDNAGGSGVAATYHRLDGGAQAAGTSIAVSATGSHTLEFWSVDVAGNVETPHKTASFEIIAPPVVDTTPPTTSSDAVASYVGAVTIHLSATDNAGGSGVAATYHRLDGGAQAAGTSIAVSATGSHTLEFWSVDVAGNVETPHKTASFSITAPPVVDTTPPTTSSDAVASYVGAVTIHLSATDNAGGSGVAATYHRLDGGAQAAGTSIAVSATGSHTLEFWSVDVAGNVETPRKTASFSVIAPSAISSSSVTLSSSASQVRLPRPFTLTGVLTPGNVGDIVVVWVKKPGSVRWSYSSARGTYAASGASGALWWYRYTPRVRGTYQFQARFAPDATRYASASRIISVSVR